MITFDVSYNGRFTKSDHNISIDGTVVDGKQTNSQLWFSVGFLF